MRIFSLCASSFASLLLAGCTMQTTAPDTESFGSTGVQQGNLHGGQQPVAFSKVQIWSVGTTGYGSKGQLFATATSLDDGFGSFSFVKLANTDTPYNNALNTWACPATGNPYMYVTATGGNTQGNHLATQTNTAAVFLLAVGQCSTISASTYWTLNEVTTVGSLSPLTQYFSPVTETIGSPSTTQALKGLANAFAVVPNLTNIATGATVGSFARSLKGVADSTKINTMADVLAACINNADSTATLCGTLFTNATAPDPAVTSQPTATFAKATDVLQALWYMLANKSDGSLARLTNLYGLVTASAPFQPTMTDAPTDWTVGITYYPNTTTNALLSSPYQVAIDTLGSAAFLEQSTAIQGWIRYLPTGYATGGAAGSYSGQYYSNSSNDARQLAYDPSGRLWITFDATPYMLTEATKLSAILPYAAYNIAIDGSGNVFYSAKVNGAIYEIPATAIPSGTTSTAAIPASASVLLTTLGSQTLDMVADASGNLWAICANGYLYEIVKANNYSIYGLNYIGTNFPVSSGSMAVDGTGGVLYPYNDGTTQYIQRVSGSPVDRLHLHQYDRIHLQ